MNKAELEAFKKQLTDLRDRLNGDVKHLANEALQQGGNNPASNLSNMPIHMADLGTDNFERENTLNLLASEQARLGEIADALERVRQGSFGKCEECEQPIPKARLKELPYARCCVDCARKTERRH